MTSTLDLDALVARIARRDREALRALYGRFATAVFSLARQIVGDRIEADEVLQDVFVQVWREAGAFDRARGSVPIWLTSITRSRAIDRLRARRRAGAAPADAGTGEELLGLATPVPGLDDDPSGLSDAGRVRMALAGLPDVQRQALLASYFGGRSHAEIAAALGTQPATIRARIAGGLHALRAALARGEAGPR